MLINIYFTLNLVNIPESSRSYYIILRYALYFHIGFLFFSVSIISIVWIVTNIILIIMCFIALRVLYRGRSDISVAISSIGMLIAYYTLWIRGYYIDQIYLFILIPITLLIVERPNVRRVIEGDLIGLLTMVLDILYIDPATIDGEELFYDLIGLLALILYTMLLSALFIYQQEIKELKRKNFEDNARYVRAAQLGQSGHWERELGTDKLYWSPEIFEIFGIDKSEKPSLEIFYSRVHPDDVGIIRNGIIQLLEKGETYHAVHRIILPSGEIRFIEEKGSPERDENGKIVRIIGASRDITELKELESEVQQYNVIISRAIQLAKISVWEYDIKEEMANNLMGSQNMISKLYSKTISKEDIQRIVKREKFERLVSEILEKGVTKKVELSIIDEGEEKTIESLITPVSIKGRDVLIGVSMDVTPFVEREKLIEEKLRANELAFREYSHRINNSLQMILSFLEIRTKVDRSSIYTLVWAIYHINKSLHKYGTEKDKVMTVKNLLNNIVRGFLDTYIQLSDTNVDTYIEGEDFNLEEKEIIPIVLIINELMVNSFKHAFRDESNTMSFQIDRKPRHIEYTDHGTYVARREKGGGLDLIRQIAKSIGGNLTIEQDGITRVSLVLKHIPDAERFIEADKVEE